MLRPWRLGGLAVIVIIGLASMLPAKPGVVKTKDGQVYEGDITEEAGKPVTVKIRGVELRVPADRVESITYSKGIEEEYQERLRALEPTDAAGRIEVAKWAMSRNQYKLAQGALEQALAIDPNSAEATRNLELVNRQMRLTATTGEHPGATPADGHPPVTQPTSQAVEQKVLKPADINIIRLMELRDSDTNVRIRIESDTKAKFAKATRQTIGDVTRLSPLAMALAIRDDPERNPDVKKLRSEVKILSDPPPLAEYRRRIQAIVMSGCGAGGCHNGYTGGGFAFIQPADNEAASYTNFYILSKYARKGAEATQGVFGRPTQHAMIDRNKPADSLLVQYGLPLDIATYPHPAAADSKQVQGFKPMFHTLQDARARQLTDWISTLAVPAPDYEIKFELPVAATRPTTRPVPAKTGDESAK